MPDWEAVNNLTGSQGKATGCEAQKNIRTCSVGYKRSYVGDKKNSEINIHTELEKNPILRFSIGSPNENIN